MSSGDRLIESIRSLNNECQIACGESLKEVWVGRKVYDSISHSIMEYCKYSEDAEDPRGKWSNGIIWIGGVKVRFDPT